MNQTETAPDVFTATTVDKERMAIRILIGDVVSRYRRQVPPDRMQKSTIEVNGGLIMGGDGSIAAGLYYPTGGNGRPPDELYRRA
ncbi:MULTISPECIES: hypothetical protein [Escherichia]|uniref:hypothetical protein n=1 Tax=Escherichia TaxID=561 RepID=UPI001EDDFCC1|nr:MULTISPECIES: hypothetical protein [unclassified Escherichia]MCF7291733.1 hypothetical protein [Escherichia coli]MED0052162.1 hypothetical protein [Escherichia coli]